MWEGREREAWDKASFLAATILTPFAKKGVRIDPRDLNPFERRRGRKEARHDEATIPIKLEMISPTLKAMCDQVARDQVPQGKT